MPRDVRAARSAARSPRVRDVLRWFPASGINALQTRDTFFMPPAIHQQFQTPSGVEGARTGEIMNL